MKNLLILSLFFYSTYASSQTFSGRIAENSTNEPLIGAIVKWVSQPSNPTMTDMDGKFSISNAGNQHQLIISFVGFKTDTVMAHGNGPEDFYLHTDAANLAEIVVKSSTSVIDRLAPQQIEIITAKELAKAACCNLSESFETNASVSVSYADAVTGARQLQMLGLAGKYVQTNIENMPGVRGLSVPFGLSHIPGTWIQSIDVAKGVSSVINGYESMAGAINVELLKPDLAERLYVNAYFNEMGRSEINLNMAHKINEKWSVGLLSHGSLLKSEIDRNDDGFRDLPKYDQFNVLNRWKYNGDRFMAQFGVNYLQENREGGQIGFKSREETPGLYGFTNQTEKATIFTKTAILFPETPYRGLGLITNTSFMDSESYFGFNPYDAKQNTFYSNLIYQDIFGNTNHTYKTGLSFLADYYDERLVNHQEEIELNRQELVPGAFFEYTFNKLDKTIIVAGIRLDQHNIYGSLFTPRLHFKQDIGANSTWRVSVGKGIRVPTPLAENYGKLVSSRKVILADAISPEVSWNFGTSWSKTFGRNALTIDVFHSEFVSQQVMDMENPGFLYFYNSTERSFASSAQVELNIVPSDRWEFKAAYRLLNVKQTIGIREDKKILADKLYVPKSLALLNVGYSLPYNKWKADATLQYNGKQRIPSGLGLEIGNEETYADGFMNLNLQISRNFVDWEYYLGAENLTNFKQENPIVGVEDPFGDTFDAGQVWGPVVGRNIYFGLRYRIR